MNPTRAILAYLAFGMALFALAGWLDSAFPSYAGLIYLGMAFALLVGWAAVRMNNRVAKAQIKRLNDEP